MTDFATDDVGNIHVLHVDDEQEALWFSKIFLESHDRSLIVDQCDSPFQALKMFRERTYDYVVSDVAMPHTDGLEFVRRLRVFSSACDSLHPLQRRGDSGRGEVRRS